MKKVMLGVVLAMFSASSFADDKRKDVKRVATVVCENSNLEIQAACEDWVKKAIVNAFTSGRLSGLCEYEIQLNKSPERIQECKKILSSSDVRPYNELKKELYP
ncbi:hypothetical protein [Budvicia aquatica]|uniref:hypothetical protein n=1 Tax=Budvicia aquatica TaxID=82979 RepID=UPI00207F5D88|nr:hypothetical protein [Budvicia aquatica]GKX50568.1 hypothetical protein SOASR029_08770 [Budvicia aquatica]